MTNRTRKHAWYYLLLPLRKQVKEHSILFDPQQKQMIDNPEKAKVFLLS